MAKKEVVKGIIEQKQEELAAILDQRDENTRQYSGIWEERNRCLGAGELLKAKELEGKYYHLRDVVGVQLDRKRIAVDTEIDNLKAEVFQLKNKLKTDTRILDRQKEDLQALKREYQNKLADKQQAISDTEFILQEADQRILELEGGE